MRKGFRTTSDFTIEDLGVIEDDVYDIEVEGCHNFFANDILVHNSCYVSIDEILKELGKSFYDENGHISRDVYEIEKTLNGELNGSIDQYLKEHFNVKRPTIAAKREGIFDGGVFLAKKRYITMVLDDEGVVHDHPVPHVTGIDIKRATCPKKIRPIIEKVMLTMLETQDRQKTMEVLNRTYDEYRKLPFEDKVVSMGCSNVSEYTARGQSSPNGIMLGTPRQIVCAIRWNNMIKADGLAGQFSPIHDNEKISLYYCKDNGDGITSFGYKDKIPDIYRERYVFDEETMYKKTVLSCLDKLFEAVGWEIPDPTKGEEDLMSLIG